VRYGLTRKEPIMTPGEVLVPGAIAIVFVVAWFVFGLIDATRPEPHREADPPAPASIHQPVPQSVRHTTRAHHR
jgi:hypothetical protein